MSGKPIVLKTLLQQRHLQGHRAFCREYDKVAGTLDAELVGSWPSRAQFYRWLSGDMVGLPYSDHCRILETMFPDWTAHELFEEQIGLGPEPRVSQSMASVYAPAPPMGGLLAEVPHNLSTHTLSGLWVTSYQFRSSRRHTETLESHIDLAHIMPESDRHIRIENHPPEPRTAGQPLPFRNEIRAELVNRHIIGHWKNTSDTRYFGSIHLAVLPGETMMEGYYTGLHSDVEVSTGRWTWVRIGLAAPADVDLSKLALREPGTIHQLIEDHSQYGGPLTLAAVTEEPN